MVAEMRTGEGKTLAATLPACTMGLMGVPVHIITVNDYLARRDAGWMGPVYEGLGLTVGKIVSGMEFEQRRRAYRCDVTYCTNKEIAFDYLRDRLELGRRPGPIRMSLERLYDDDPQFDRLRLRGLCYGIVDEADSVLIDEARTPLIISGPGDSSYEAEVYRQAMNLAEGLESEADYHIDFPKRTVELTDDGKDHLEELGLELGGIWTGRLRREEMVRQALTAKHLFHLDKHYVVKRGRVQIVDEYTGRVMPGRSWERGLHQLIETKERCAVTTETETLARISYQRFFRRYLSLAGMTGTAREGAREFWSVYRLHVVNVPTHQPMILEGLPARVFRTAEEKWQAVARRIAELHALGRPILVGTRTVVDSEHLGQLLFDAGLTYRILNAKQDEEEAEIIAEAGQRNHITVATNMAGRGTDIKLGEGVAGLGGLHVIGTARHDAGRIDRQLFGRAGRQGDPGTFEMFVSLEDEILEAHPSRVLGFLGPQRLNPVSRPGRWLADRLFRNCQRTAERRFYRARCDLLKMDENVDSALAFSGAGE
jgi:preprotein translocase subunit SecA